jgi:TLC ATP/ADP transporter
MYVISKLYTNDYYIILFWDGMMNKIISLNHLREIYAKLNVHTNYSGKFDNNVIIFLIYNTMNTSSDDIQFIGHLIKFIEKTGKPKMNLDNNIKKYKTYEIMINNVDFKLSPEICSVRCPLLFSL